MEESRPSANRETTSLIDESEGFYGRDADKEAIIDMLISDDDNGSNPGVIPIVGDPGMGKTTLAQHVYNDKAVEEHFKIRAWVCVPHQFDETKLTKEIVEKVTGTACPYGDLAQLQRKLKEALDGKKFLLVLDDFWTEEYELTTLSSGAEGSKIIVTTRCEEVASCVQTVATHDLRALEDEDCWKLFARQACLDVNSTANPPELLEIGRKIVSKCEGLPLAVKALGGVLRWQTRWQTRAEKWTEVLQSEIWDDKTVNILPALKMSYIHLPSHLKRCFAYCAIFPQGYRFPKEELVALWISQSFVVQQKANRSLEEIGGLYFDELVSTSLFQQSSNLRGEPWFVMRDLVHHLASFVLGETPYLRSFVLADMLSCYCGVQNLAACINEEKCINKEVIDGYLSTQKPLRVLCLSCYGIKELPNSIGNLKHMRHLDLSCTSISSLPDAVTGLFNLEILILRQCWKLVELPADMARLINLCQLDLRGTALKGMPTAMGKLKKLSNLSDFVVGEIGGSSIKELGHLHYLRGQISVRGLENVKDGRDASEVILKDKKNVKVLELRWHGDADNPRQEKRVLERLQPHMQIECIWIHNYGGKEFPNWVGSISFSKLEKLHLNGCKNCTCLPPLGQLASLEELSVDGGYNEVLKAVGVEFYRKFRSGEKPFPSLKRLVFDRMMNWREWSSCNGAFPVLEELELHNCPKLMSVPIHLPSLKHIRIENCAELDFENISTCASLETICIRGSEKGKCISLETFTNLKKVEIWDCYNLESLWSAAASTTATTSLTSLHIQGCYKLESFPGEGLDSPNLKSMTICSCDNLKSLPQGMHSLLPSLEVLAVSYCPEIESFPDGGLPSKLQSLEIEWCEKLVGGRLQWDLQSLPCLSSIKIGGGLCEDAESSFPEETLLPSFLQSLEIGGFAKLKYLNYKGLQHLTSLQSLIIEGCNNLESLPEEELLSCLSSLHIHGCPLLEKRCEREKGRDWPKIRHIPDLRIDT